MKYVFGCLGATVALILALTIWVSVSFVAGAINPALGGLVCVGLPAAALWLWALYSQAVRRQAATMANRGGTAALAIAIAFGALGLTTPVANAQSDQASCEALAQGYGNVAHPEEPNWVSCFTQGWVNWVFSADRPLPATPPEAVEDALRHGLFVQLTEPWRGGCDNTLTSPHCNIGYLKLFSDWGTLRAFLAKGEITLRNTTKVGPWSEGSLWITDDFIEVAPGDTVADDDVALFLDGALGWAFAENYPLPTTVPGGLNTFYLHETWRGGCIGDQLPDANCNVGQIKTFTNWVDMLAYLKENNWDRGSVWANRADMMPSDGIDVQATQVPTTVAPQPTPEPPAPPEPPVNPIILFIERMIVGWNSFWTWVF